jgi:hypothetical protein
MVTKVRDVAFACDMDLKDRCYISDMSMTLKFT